MDTKKIQDKIQKLLALANSPNEAEAAAAAAMAQRLMMQYGIEEIKIQGDEEVERFDYRGMMGTRKAGWKRVLLTIVAKVNACEHFGVEGDPESVIIWGKKQHRENAIRVYQYLEATVERIAVSQCRGKGRSYATAFKLGMANRLCDRLSENLQATLQNGIESEEGTTSALVVKGWWDKEQSLLKDAMRGQRTRSASTSCSDREAYAQGQHAANRVHLGGQLNSGAPKTKALAGR